MFRVISRSMSSAVNSVKTPIPVYGIQGRYVKALYSAALQKQQLKDVEKHMRILLKELNNAKMMDFVENKFIRTGTKGRLLKEAGQQVGMPETAANFLKVVAQNGRLKLLKRMILMFLDVMAAHRNEALCEVTTVEPLDDATRKKLIEAIQNHVEADKKIQLHEKVDDAIIGGMIISIEDMYIDMSILGRINMYTNILNQPV